MAENKRRLGLLADPHEELAFTSGAQQSGRGALLRLQQPPQHLRNYYRGTLRTSRGFAAAPPEEDAASLCKCVKLNFVSKQKGKNMESERRKNLDFSRNVAP